MQKSVIGGACLNQIPLDWKGNFQRIIKAIEIAREKNIKILALPELCITGYACEDWYFAPYFLEKAKEQLKALLPYTQGMGVAVGLPYHLQGKTYNAIAFLADGKVQGITAKQFLANDGVYYEHRWFKAWQHNECISIEDAIFGSIAFGAATYAFADRKIAIEVCEDSWQGKARPAISYSKQGVDTLLICNASHFYFEKEKLREHIVKEANALELDVVYVNLLGNEAGELIFDGDVIIAEKDKGIVAQNERFSFQELEVKNSLEGMPQNKLSKEEEFYAAASLGLWDYLRKTKSNCYVLSLSGGADSACCAVLVHLMCEKAIASLGFEAVNSLLNLKAENVLELFEKILITAYQSTENSSEHTKQSAEELAKSLGATFYDWSISPSVNLFVETIQQELNREITWQSDDLALQNIQARARSPFIWLLTNLKKGLLLTTSNRSEGSVGYCTMDGDTSGSLAPIAGVDKHFIKQWLVWAESNLGYKGLKYVNALAPSAELRPLASKQTDEADLMPYELLNEIEKLAIGKHFSPVEVYKTLSQHYAADELKPAIHKFYTLWSRNQWKRGRLAPSFNLDKYNVNPRSWCRFPILSAGFEMELEELNFV